VRDAAANGHRRPTGKEDGTGGRRERGAHVSERGGVPTASGGLTGEGANRPGSESQSPTRFRDGSPVWFRFRVVGEVEEHGYG
jgi:hypothetical protein